jgi:hypothetical protein
LRSLSKGDYLIFYAGLQEWDEEAGWLRDKPPALYIVGYFVVEMAGLATYFSKTTLRAEFRQNFHVRYRSVFENQQERLVLVKGGRGSRLLRKARRISAVGVDRAGRPLKILSRQMRKVFGGFDGKVAIQRSPPRWVEPPYVERAIQFVRGLK